MPDFTQAIVLITGAASGIGAATATRLAEAGARKLILMDRDEDKLRDFAFTLPCERQIRIGDVADERLWEREDLTGLTHAVINAGIGAGGPIADTSFADWRQVMSINLDGVFLTLQAAMKAMRDTGGAIVLTASVAGVKAERGIAAYGSVQGGGHPPRPRSPPRKARRSASGSIRSLRAGSRPRSGKACRSSPSWSSARAGKRRSRRWRRTARSARFGKPEEIAAQIAFLLSEEAAFMTGACLVSDGGYSL